jgi:hypothetical protein
MCQNFPSLYYLGPHAVCRTSYRLLKLKVKNSNIFHKGTANLLRGCTASLVSAQNMVRKHRSHDSRSIFFCRVGVSIHKSDPNSQLSLLYSMCNAVCCSVGPDVYQTMLVQVAVKTFAGPKFSSAIQGFHDTVKFASCNTVWWTVTQDISKVDNVKYVSFMAVVESEFCLNLNMSYVVLTHCNSTTTK